jgi:hypothetical protein
VYVYAIQEVSYERVPESADIKPPKRGIKFFGGFQTRFYFLGFPMVVWQYVIVGKFIGITNRPIK